MNDKKQDTLQELIAQCVADALKDEDIIRKSIKEHIGKAVDSVVSDMFTWGECKKQIQTKLNELMIPAIQNYDFSEYVTSLENVLNELLSSPGIARNNKMLSNFKTIMTPPSTDAVDIKDVFKKYCEFIAENVNTDGREIVYEDGPAYESVNCVAEGESIDSPYNTYSSQQKMRICFHVDESEKSNETEYGEPLNFDVILSRWTRYDKPNEWTLEVSCNPHSVAGMSSFESYLVSLRNSNIKIILKEGASFFMDENVTPEKEPEPEYH